MVEATTPTPKKEEATPQGGKEAITSDKPKQEPQTPPEETKTVADLQSEVDTLTKNLDQATKLQGQADRKTRTEKVERKKLEIELKRIKSGDTYIPPEEPEGESQIERETRLEAKVGIQNLILDNPEYQELIKQDVTLKEVLRNNPFALIGEYLDAEDAVEQIKDMLDKRVSSLKIQKEKDQSKGDTGKEKGKEEGGEKFEAGPVQPAGEPPETPPKEPSGQTPVENVEKSIESKINFT